MTIQPKTTYRGENDSGQLEIRKSFSVSRDRIKVWKDENDNGTEVTYIEVPVSSPSEDRDGDEFSEDGLENQRDQFRSGEIGMWLDHGLSPETNFPDYRVLEQIGGWKDAEIRERELFATAALRPSSEEADELRTMLDEGVAPVGFSVGFIVEDAEEKSEGDGMRFNSVDLLECSAVGIPSNPDAMVSDSAMATAKAVADAGGYDGEPERLARAITSEMRSLPYTEQRNQSMQGKQSDEKLQAALATLNDYLEVDGTSGEDPITDVADWASETDGEDAEAVTDVAETAADDLDVGSMDELTAMMVVDFIDEQFDNEEESSGNEEDEEEEESSGETGDGKSENDPPELRSAVREALKETLPEALTSEEALRSLIGEEVRDALSEEEFEVEVTDSFVEELRSEMFKDSDRDEKPAPAGTISTYEGPEGEESGGGDEGGDKGGSGNASKPSPAFGGK